MSILGRRVSLKAIVGNGAGHDCWRAASRAERHAERARSRWSRRTWRSISRAIQSTRTRRIEVKAGERVRVVLRNQDRGMTHDFAVPVLGAAVAPMRWNESDDVVVRRAGRRRDLRIRVPAPSAHDARHHSSLLTLRSTISTPEGKRRYVRQLFATIADRYDFITGFLSYGQDRRWKRRLIDLAAAGPSIAFSTSPAAPGTCCWPPRTCPPRHRSRHHAPDAAARQVEAGRH